MSGTAPKNVIKKVPQDHKKPAPIKSDVVAEVVAEEVQVRYCPFKKATDFNYQYIDEAQENMINTSAIENFRECIGELCMGFNPETGGCRLLSK